MTSHELPREITKRFIVAGKAVFTVRNRETGNRFTYKVTKTDGTGKVSHFVKALTGSDNEGAYTYLGHIYRDGRYAHGHKSRLGPETQSAKVFVWFWARLSANTLLEQIEVWHEGKCGRCGRTLTVPESIERGIGPDCAQKMGLAGTQTETGTDDWDLEGWLEAKHEFARLEAKQERQAYMNMTSRD